MHKTHFMSLLELGIDGRPPLGYGGWFFLVQLIFFFSHVSRTPALDDHWHGKTSAGLQLQRYRRRRLQSSEQRH
jgi:hypothetical protein